VVGVLGYIMNKTIVVVEKRLVHWAAR